MENDMREEFAALPFHHLRPFFVAPSRLPEFTETVAEVAEMKAMLSRKLIQLTESRKKKDEKRMEKLHGQCSWLRVEIYLSESQASVMRNELVQRIYLEVRSVQEMMAVNDLRSAVGVGATPGMRRFGGKICTAANLPEEVIKAIKIADRFQQTF